MHILQINLLKFKLDDILDDNFDDKKYLII